MPRTNPTQYESVAIPKRLPIVTVPNNRDGTFAKDSRLVNCYAEKDQTDGEYWVEKRPGYGPVIASPVASGLNIGRGLYKWVPKTGAFSFFTVNNNRLSKLLFDGTTPTLLGNVGTGPNLYTFETIRSTPLTAVLNDGANAYYTDGTTVTPMIGLPNFPTQIVKGWAYLDGTLYVMDINSNIYGSTNIDDPTAWSALNVINARYGSGIPKALIRHKEYVVALKQTTTQFFFDNANPAGSPLSILRGATFDFGCLSADTVLNIDGETFWVTDSENGGAQVCRLTNGVPNIISTPAVERLLIGYTGVFDTITASSIKAGGHRFYTVSFRTNGLKEFTLVYDLDEKLWMFWYNALQTAAWTIAQQAGLDGNGRELMQNYLTGQIHVIAEDYIFSNDNGTPARVDIITQDYDFGTQRVKQCERMSFKADTVPFAQLLVAWSDDDYATFSAFQNVQLQEEEPFISGLGTFVNRSFDFRFGGDLKFRIKSTDIQLDIGTL